MTRNKITIWWARYTPYYIEFNGFGRTEEEALAGLRKEFNKIMTDMETMSCMQPPSYRDEFNISDIVFVQIPLGDGIAFEDGVIAL